MPQARGRRFLHVAVALAVAATALAPAMHVHEGDADHRSLAHRHFAPHQNDRAKISDSDERITWLNDVSLPGTTLDDVLVAVVVGAIAGVERPSTDSIRGRVFDTAPPHGPPRTPGALRGPPSLA